MYRKFQRGDRVVVSNTAGFHKGARGVVEFVQPNGFTKKHVWVLRDGASSPVFYVGDDPADSELMFEDPEDGYLLSKNLLQKHLDASLNREELVLGAVWAWEIARTIIERAEKEHPYPKIEAPVIDKECNILETIQSAVIRLFSSSKNGSKSNRFF